MKWDSVPNNGKLDNTQFAFAGSNLIFSASFETETEDKKRKI